MSAFRPLSALSSRSRRKTKLPPPLSFAVPKTLAVEPDWAYAVKVIAVTVRPVVVKVRSPFMVGSPNALKLKFAMAPPVSVILPLPVNLPVVLGGSVHVLRGRGLGLVRCRARISDAVVGVVGERRDRVGSRHRTAVQERCRSARRRGAAARRRAKGGVGAGNREANEHRCHEVSVLDPSPWR